jgi:hypothetical protein
MTIDDVNRLMTYWHKYPPLRDLVAAFIGFEPAAETEQSDRYMTADDLKRVMAMTGGRVPGMS